MKSTKKEKYIDHIVKNLPKNPGVYKFKDKKGEIIYIGKAKNLNNRIKNYFQKSKDKTVKTQKMVEQIEDIDYTIVDSDLEAIMLETNMIKEHRPKYNILMKDDKSYVYIKITVNEDFPRILITRKVEKDKARYFGPKTAQHKVQKTLKVLKRIFPYRHCNLSIDYEFPTKNPIAELKRSESSSSALSRTGKPGTSETSTSYTKRKHKVKVTKAGIKYPCIDYHIKRCIGPCIGTVSKEEYRKIIDQVISFLEGKHDKIIKKVKENMQKAAAEKKFELAASIRDKLKAVEDIMETQRISTPDQKDLDVINYVITDEKIFFNLFQIRSGKLINQENFELTEPKRSVDSSPPPTPDYKTIHEQSEFLLPNALGSFIKQYYEKATDIPQEVLIPHQTEELSTLEKWLTASKGTKVKITIPQKGRKDKLLELSLKNAQNYSKLSKTKWQGHEKSNREKALTGLQELLKLEKTPRRLECYDVSHLGGSQTVSSMVVFENGFPKKSDYRKFKLHQEDKPDDFASMEETLERRLKYLKPSIKENQIKVLKSTKKELKTLKQKKDHQYFTIKDEKKKIKGYIHIFEPPKQKGPSKKVLIKKIEFKSTKKQPDLRTIIKKTAEKTKTKRIYISVQQKDIKKYEEIGCQNIAKVPDKFKIPKTHAPLVYDTTKYKPDSSFKKTPNLIIIDGGKGQLSSALKALKKYKLTLPIISIAKKHEEIYLPNTHKPIILPSNNPILHLIQHIRNESHRFAITYHQGLQIKVTKSSALDKIPGIGDTTKMKLLRHFSSPEGIKNATMHELAQIVGKKTAMKLKKEL